MNPGILPLKVKITLSVSPSKKQLYLHFINIIPHVIFFSQHNFLFIKY